MTSQRNRAARRLTVTLILVVSGAASGVAAPATAATTTISVNPEETTLAQFTLMDIWVSSSWESGGQVLVAMNEQEIVDGTANSSGSYISGDVPVPAGTAHCGSNEVDWLSDGDFIASTTVMVYCPTVQVTPDTLNTAGGPASFTVTGTGYPVDREMVLTLDGSSTPINTYTLTDPNGGFTYAANVRALPCGRHRLTATSQPPPIIESERPGAATVLARPPLPASTTFTVTGCASSSPSPSPSPSNPTQPPPPQRGAPKITANPTVLIDGTLTHVTGTGFIPNQPVALTWQTPAGATLSVCSPDADSAPPLKSDATGKIDTFCYARPHETLGAAQIVAVQGTAHAAAPVVVEGGSMQPSSGDQFIFRR